VRNLAISDAAAPYDLYYAPDPSSQIACSIGGNVAENSGGVHCLKYGLTVNNVIKVRAVLMDGEIVEFGTEALDAPGLDLLGVMIGSEGMLAVVTEVTVRLIPKPPVARVIMASFDDMTKAGHAVADVIAAGLIPAGLEMMDKPATRAVEEFVHAGYDIDAEAILLCESDGTAEEVEEEIARMSDVLRQSGGPYLARLLLHGWDDPQKAHRNAAQPDQGHGGALCIALHERVSCRGRQYASPDSVRWFGPGSVAPRRSVR
jgi:glycolate oxidase